MFGLSQVLPEIRSSELHFNFEQACSQFCFQQKFWGRGGRVHHCLLWCVTNKRGHLLWLWRHYQGAAADQTNLPGTNSSLCRSTIISCGWGLLQIFLDAIASTKIDHWVLLTCHIAKVKQTVTWIRVWEVFLKLGMCWLLFLCSIEMVVTKRGTQSGCQLWLRLKSFIQTGLNLASCTSVMHFETILWKFQK